jgi:hypothetical protein
MRGRCSTLLPRSTLIRRRRRQCFLVRAGRFAPELTSRRSLLERCRWSLPGPAAQHLQPTCAPADADAAQRSYRFRPSVKTPYNMRPTSTTTMMPKKM